jgi:hypothetical protein
MNARFRAAVVTIPAVVVSAVAFHASSACLATRWSSLQSIPAERANISANTGSSCPSVRSAAVIADWMKSSLLGIPRCAAASEHCRARASGIRIVRCGSDVCVIPKSLFGCNARDASFRWLSTVQAIAIPKERRRSNQYRCARKRSLLKF